MTLHSYAGFDVHVNDEGFLLDANQWTPSVGEAIAAELGISLKPDHWVVINFAREDFAGSGKSPGLRRISGNTGVAIKQIYKMFPKGPGKLVARIAGTRLNRSPVVRLNPVTKVNTRQSNGAA